MAIYRKWGSTIGYADVGAPLEPEQASGVMLCAEHFSPGGQPATVLRTLFGIRISASRRSDSAGEFALPPYWYGDLGFVACAWAADPSATDAPNPWIGAGDLENMVATIQPELSIASVPGPAATAPNGQVALWQGSVDSHGQRGPFGPDGAMVKVLLGWNYASPAANALPETENIYWRVETWLRVLWGSTTPFP